MTKENDTHLKKKRIMKKLLSLPPNLVECFHDITGHDHKEWFCSNDPIGKKLGSGGGTTWLMQKAFEADCKNIEGDGKAIDAAGNTFDADASSSMPEDRAADCRHMPRRERFLPQSPYSVGSADSASRRICFRSRFRSTSR